MQSDCLCTDNSMDSYKCDKYNSLDRYLILACQFNAFYRDVIKARANKHSLLIGRWAGMKIILRVSGLKMSLCPLSDCLFALKSLSIAVTCRYTLVVSRRQASHDFVRFLAWPMN